MSNSSPVRVLLADDHAMVLQGLQLCLAEDAAFEVVGIAANGIQAIAQIREHRPDLAVLDMAMPGANGLEVIEQARHWSPETRIVVLTGTADARLLVRLVGSDVAGVLLKTASAEDLLTLLHQVARGRRVISPEVRRMVDGEGPTVALSPRELEVLQAVALGLSNARIAERLGISPKTVDSHRTNLMQKMEVSSTASLLVKAMREGLIDVTTRQD